jgi:murein DD-endopeptidase MepM/ murein hydrolase activator NlpD
LTAKRGKGWTLVIIPENESGARQIRLPRRAVHGVIALFGLIVLYALVETGLFLSVARKAAELEPLRKRVRELEGSSEELARMGSELNKLRQFQAQVKRVLGGTASAESEPPDWMRETGGRTPESSLPISATAKPISELTPAGAVPYSALDIPTMPPLQGYFTRGFHTANSARHFAHLGIDLAAKTGSPVVAAADGIVIFAGWDTTLGHLAILLHRSGYITRYGHNQSLLCRNGQRVVQGEPIALMGNSGVSSAPHLHFEVWKDGAPVDPSLLIRNFP